MTDVYDAEVNSDSTVFGRYTQADVAIFGLLLPLHTRYLHTLGGFSTNHRADQDSGTRTPRRARRPENTLPAFQYAIKQGVDALEMDMAVTKDNVIVISHDPILHPPVCTGPAPSAIIHQLTLAEVRKWDCGAVRNPRFPTQQTEPGTRIPTLDDVFQLAKETSTTTLRRKAPLSIRNTRPRPKSLCGWC